MSEHTGVVTTSAKKTTITAKMVMDLFGTVVTLEGIYSNDQTTLRGTVDLSKEEKGLVQTLTAQLPDLIRSIIPDIRVKEVSVSLEFNRTKGLQYYAVAGKISIENRNIAFRLFQKDKATLLSLELSDTITLTGLPLVGEYLSPQDGISDLQLVYYNEGEDGNKTFGDLLKSPAVLSRYPQYKALVQKGLNIFAGIRIGEFNTPLSFPLQALEDKSPKKIAEEKDKAPKDAVTQLSAATDPPKKKFLDVKQTALVYKDGKIGFLVSGAVNIGVFELELMGLQVLAELGIFREFSLKKLSFNLEGLSIDIQKAPLSVTGAFLRAKNADKDADYLGLLNVGFKQFQFTAVGAYSQRAGYTSIFVYAFIGLPLGGPPFFFVTGMAFGMGINRDFVLPDIGRISRYPLLTVCMDKGSPGAVTPPANNKEGVLEMLRLLNESIPPAPGAYFLVAGIRFESFKVIRTIALAVVKVGHELEINLLGISSLSLPSVYVELAFSVQFAPARGIFMARGLLTASSYILFPGLKLSGGFAVGFWFSGEHAGDFVVSMGGYHPRYKAPAHFPSNIPRIGIYGKLDQNVTITGELYFALTPQAIMAGLFASLVYSDGWLYASISLRADFIILWKPFYYEADIAVDVYVRFTIGVGFLSKDFSFHLSAGIMVWGPDFSGKAFLDAGVKTFRISFGANAPRFAADLTWDEFRNAFIPPSPCAINVAAGLVHKAKIKLPGTGIETEVWVINPKELELLTDSIIPATKAILSSDPLLKDNTFPVPGIAPMGRKTFDAGHKVTIYAGWGSERTLIKENDPRYRFKFDKVTKNLPKAVWGTGKPDSKTPPKGDESLMKGLLTGVKIVAEETISGASREFKEDELAFVKTNHRTNTGAMKGSIKKNEQPAEKDVTHQNYVQASELRNRSLQILSGLLPEEKPEVSDVSGKIPVYTYTEPFIETQFSWNK